MKQRSPKIFIKDILTFFKRIEIYTKNFNFEDFQGNQMVIDAVVRNLEIIGEASNNIPKAIKEKYDSISWSEMIGLRNITAHKYFELDLTIIWDIIKKDIPKTKELIEKMSNELDEEEKMKK